MIRVMFEGGRYAGMRRVSRTPELLVVTMGHEHVVYERVDDWDGNFTGVYRYNTTRYGTEEALGLAEQGRRLASEREDLIASGVDPAELAVPIHPDDGRKAQE